MRTRRHVLPVKDDDFFIGTAASYISLWQQISGAFFAVFLMVSSISAVVGGIVIMNVNTVAENGGNDCATAASLDSQAAGFVHSRQLCNSQRGRNVLLVDRLLSD